MRLQDGVQHVDDVSHADIGGLLCRCAERLPELAAHSLPIGTSACQHEQSLLHAAALQPAST